MIAPAEDGIRSVEIANAMQYSLMTKKRVELPMDSAAYEAHLKELIAKSTFKKVTDKSADKSLSGSFGNL
ncbi:MAG: hypothetical protein GX617_16175 [Lentisphaerae bacterium]|nr:hypothetical protein [Lentisphaerota bacterium]